MNRFKEQARGNNAHASGFSLVETVIAIAVIAVTFIGLIGLLGVGVANDQASAQQTVANNIAASILADLRSTPAYSTTGKSTRYGLVLPTGPANATAPINSSATPLNGVPAQVLYFDNSPVFLSLGGSVPSSAVYCANVYMARMTYMGPVAMQSNDMVRVVISWPAKATTTPAGSVDITSQFVIH